MFVKCVWFQFGQNSRPKLQNLLLGLASSQRHQIDLTLVSQFHLKQQLEAKPGINDYFAEYKTEPTCFSSEAQLHCTVPKPFSKIIDLKQNQNI